MFSRFLRISSYLLIVFYLVNVITLHGQKYQPSWSSIDSRPLPTWFGEAKFGISIQWGPYSVPAWSPRGSFSDWYQFWLINRSVYGNEEYKGDEVYEYHKMRYGNEYTYYDFGYEFKAVSFDPEFWTNLISDAGAKYVLFSAKHYDGYCLWPNPVVGDRGFRWNSKDVGSGRDLVGEFTSAVRKTDLKLGFSYALKEWFHPLWKSDKNKFVLEHTHTQIKDLLNLYKPDLLWTNGEWDLTAEEWRAQNLISWIYSQSSVKDNIVLNDRWGKGTRHKHGGYYTTEYSSGYDQNQTPWEEHRGMALSMGLNKNEQLQDYASAQTLILNLINVVSHGGNLLLSISPDGEGNIPLIQQQRLLEIGRWLDNNGEAIYATKKWKTPTQLMEGNPTEENLSKYVPNDHILSKTINSTPGKAAIQVFFTYKENNLYAILPSYPSKFLWLKDVESTDETSVSFLSNNKILEWSQMDQDIRITIPALSTELFDTKEAYVIKVTNVKGFVKTPQIIVENEHNKNTPTKITLISNSKAAMIFYTIDGTEPTTRSRLYKRSFIVNKPADLKVKAFIDGMSPSNKISRSINRPINFGEIILESQPSDPFKGHSPSMLIDGKRGGEDINGGKWMGFLGKDAEVVVDLGEERKIKNIQLGYMHRPSERVYAPVEVNIEVSNDSFNYKGFKKLQKIRPHTQDESVVSTFKTPIYNTRARYIYIHAKNLNLSKESWILLDEIIIE